MKSTPSVPLAPDREAASADRCLAAGNLPADTTCRRCLSRRIDEIAADGTVRVHSLSVLTLTLRSDGSITEADVAPFVSETWGTTYVDAVITLRRGADGSISVSF
ncbi:MAG: hypothetical protein J6L73_04300 [Muribaculaceae bacterium]|nr:hypothetical protein [Muribaculaceae bacterium]